MPTGSSISLVLRTLPLSTNNLYAHVGRHRFLTQTAKANKEAMAWEVLSQYRGGPLEGPLELSIALWWPTKRNHDVDNVKGLIDSLTGILWLDDGQIESLHVRKGHDKANPRVELLLSPLPQ